MFFFQYADPVADLLDKTNCFRTRLFRESCVYYKGNYVKVCIHKFHIPLPLLADDEFTRCLWYKMLYYFQWFQIFFFLRITVYSCSF